MTLELREIQLIMSVPGENRNFEPKNFPGDYFGSAQNQVSLWFHCIKEEWQVYRGEDLILILQQFKNLSIYFYTDKKVESLLCCYEKFNWKI